MAVMDQRGLNLPAGIDFAVAMDGTAFPRQEPDNRHDLPHSGNPVAGDGRTPPDQASAGRAERGADAPEPTDPVNDEMSRAPPRPGAYGNR
ncbi:hypothetical protein [Phreatobacter stygius]|uniref:Uncharacterized protein n=1 Tax=Phreatobacter stygius TaxID=1940610 RepID=A0A4D7B261_9HYPH|nr:hypothetical protein [Phreatobacter stygius]QCI63616.1 hypothetical protein E8M01_04800 [Phreatobacter stygius]